MNKPDWIKFVRWVITNLLFGIIPLSCTWGFRKLFNKTAIEAGNDYPEIVFLAIAICVTSLVDTLGRKNRNSYGMTFTILKLSLIMELIGSAILYGALRLVSIATPSETASPINGFNPPSLSSVIIFTVCCAITGIVAEILVTYTEGAGITAEEVTNKELTPEVAKPNA